MTLTCGHVCGRDEFRVHGAHGRNYTKSCFGYAPMGALCARGTA